MVKGIVPWRPEAILDTKTTFKAEGGESRGSWEAPVMECFIHYMDKRGVIKKRKGEE